MSFFANVLICQKKRKKNISKTVSLRCIIDVMLSWTLFFGLLCLSGSSLKKKQATEILQLDITSKRRRSVKVESVELVLIALNENKKPKGNMYSAFGKYSDPLTFSTFRYCNGVRGWVCEGRYHPVR